MKLCGQISVELSVHNFLEAADHQRKLEEMLDFVRKAYPAATLTMRERRDRKPIPLTPAAPRSHTGALNRYRDE